MNTTDDESLRDDSTTTRARARSETRHAARRRRPRRASSRVRSRVHVSRRARRRERGHGRPRARASDAVATPATTAEAAALVRECARRRIAVVPRGAGTGLEGGCVAHAGGVVVDTSALRGVEVFAADGVARVGAGVKKWDSTPR